MIARTTLAAIAAAALVSAPLAQAQAPAAAPAAAADASVVKPNCTKPGDVPNSLSSENQKKAWQRDYTAWGDCMKKFINDQRALAEPYNKAANAAIEDYNGTVAKLNDQIEKVRDAAK